VILFALAALQASVASARIAVKPDTDLQFRRFIKLAEEGKTVDGVTDADVSIRQEDVEIDLVAPSGKRTLFLHPQDFSSPWKGRFFALEIGPAGTTSDAARVVQILDSLFADSPFVVESDGMDGHGSSSAVPLDEAWHSGGMAGIAQATVDRGAGSASRSYVTVVSTVQAVLLLLCLGVGWARLSRQP
jgi:hypothetical protein